VKRRPKDVTGGGGGKNLGRGPRIFPAGRTPGDFTGVFSIENFVKVKLLLSDVRGENLKNGMIPFQRLRQDFAIIGYFLSHTEADSSRVS
jgi:hypothetical protein